MRKDIPAIVAEFGSKILFDLGERLEQGSTHGNTMIFHTIEPEGAIIDSIMTAFGEQDIDIMSYSTQVYMKQDEDGNIFNYVALHILDYEA
jgi:hypothetical protein